MCTDRAYAASPIDLRCVRMRARSESTRVQRRERELGHGETILSSLSKDQQLWLLQEESDAFQQTWMPKKEHDSVQQLKDRQMLSTLTVVMRERERERERFFAILRR